MTCNEPTSSCRKRAVTNQNHADMAFIPCITYVVGSHVGVKQLPTSAVYLVDFDKYSGLSCVRNAKEN